MAKTKKPKQKPTKTAYLYKRSTVYGLLILIISGVVFYFVWGAYQNKVADTKRVKKINNAGVLLDTVEDDLETTGINAQIKRYSYCWRTGEKYGEGTRYCDQRLFLYASPKNPTETIAEAKILQKVLENTTGFTAREGLFEGEYKNGSLINIESLSESSDQASECVFRYNAYSPEYDGEFAQSYIVDIVCYEKVDSEDIYPLDARYSSDYLIEQEYQ